MKVLLARIARSLTTLVNDSFISNCGLLQTHTSHTKKCLLVVLSLLHGIKIRRFSHWGSVFGNHNMMVESWRNFSSFFIKTSFNMNAIQRRDFTQGWSMMKKYIFLVQFLKILTTFGYMYKLRAERANTPFYSIAATHFSFATTARNSLQWAKIFLSSLLCWKINCTAWKISSRILTRKLRTWWYVVSVSMLTSIEFVVALCNSMILVLFE